jgi:hypothetical protein
MGYAQFLHKMKDRRHRKDRKRRGPGNAIGKDAHMTGIWAASAQTYLLVLATTATLFFAIPIFVQPLKWARLMLWRVPAETGLAIYFGRCLGAFILVIEILMFRAGLYGTGLVLVFKTMMTVWLFMVAVHLRGLDQRHSAAHRNARDRALAWSHRSNARLLGRRLKRRRGCARPWQIDAARRGRGGESPP